MSAFLEYQWEWPANRAIEKKLLVRIEKIGVRKAGFFGLNRTPSLTRNLPSPLVVIGLVIDQSGKTSGKPVKVVAPGMEVEGIKPGSLAMFGLLGNKICICIQPVDISSGSSSE